jgi:peptidoglycan/LPS O-acetylase OafA/YrhL
MDGDHVPGLASPVGVKPEHHNNFDLIRCFAALQVLQAHAASVIDLPGRPYWLVFILQQFPGVTVFFIVSGFLITSSYLRGSGELLPYFARRGLRIYPALWVNVSVILLLLAATMSLSPALTLTSFLLWLFMTFTIGSDIYGNFVTGGVTDPNGFYAFFPSGVLWTIPIELTFYALMPLILRSRMQGKRYGWLALLLTTTGSLTVLGFYLHVAGNNPDSLVAKALSINPLTDLWIFMLGAALAAYWHKIRWTIEGRFLLWLAVYLGVAVFEATVFGVTNLNMHTLSPLMPLKIVLLAGVVVSFAFTWRNLASFLRGNDVSYGLYLYHMPIILTFAALGIKGEGYLWLPVLGASFLLAGLSWIVVERPALRLKARIGRRHFPRQTDTAAVVVRD